MMTTIPQLFEVGCEAKAPGEVTPSMRAAYERVAPEIAAVPDADLVRLNVDVPSAVSTVLASLPAVRSVRADIVAGLPTIDVASLDKLEDYALALAHLHAAHAHAADPKPELPAMYTQAVEFRDAFLEAARTLVRFKLIDASTIDGMGVRTGYRNVAFELASICGLLRESWSSIAGKCPVTLEQVERGDVLANLLVLAAAERDKAPSLRTTAAKERQRAFTLFSRAYAEVRRAVAFLRWYEGDAETIAPAYYVGRAGRGADKADDAEGGADAGPTDSPGGASEVARPTKTPLYDGTFPGFGATAGEPKGDPLFTTPSDEPFVRR